MILESYIHGVESILHDCSTIQLLLIKDGILAEAPIGAKSIIMLNIIEEQLRSNQNQKQKQTIILN